MTDLDSERDENAYVERLARERTPGPWRIAPRYPQSPNSPYEILTANGDISPAYVLAVAPGGHHSGEANARLIAAAPELLAALEKAYETDLAEARFEGYDFEGSPLGTMMRAAIAKARGEA